MRNSRSKNFLFASVGVGVVSETVFFYVAISSGQQAGELIAQRDFAGARDLARAKTPPQASSTGFIAGHGFEPWIYGL